MQLVPCLFDAIPLEQGEGPIQPHLGNFHRSLLVLIVLLGLAKQGDRLAIFICLCVEDALVDTNSGEPLRLVTGLIDIGEFL
ncbi:hypothetical protein D3C76_896650 [compost metagenome]